MSCIKGSSEYSILLFYSFYLNYNLFVAVLIWSFILSIKYIWRLWLPNHQHGRFKGFKIWFTNKIPSNISQLIIIYNERKNKRMKKYWKLCSTLTWIIWLCHFTLKSWLQYMIVEDCLCLECPLSTNKS